MKLLLKVHPFSKLWFQLSANLHPYTVAKALSNNAGGACFRCATSVIDDVDNLYNETQKAAAACGETHGGRVCPAGAICVRRSRQDPDDGSCVMPAVNAALNLRILEEYSDNFNRPGSGAAPPCHRWADVALPALGRDAQPAHVIGRHV